jgi:hypothetical protein
MDYITNRTYIRTIIMKEKTKKYEYPGHKDPLQAAPGRPGIGWWRPRRL